LEVFVADAIVFCSFDQGRDGLPAGAREVLTLGRKIAAARGVDLDWLVLGPLPERAAEIAAGQGVAHLDHVADAKLAEFRADAVVAAAGQYSEREKPGLLLMAQTFDARLVAPRVAGRIGVGVVMNAVDIEASDEVRVTATAYGGDTRVEYEISAGQPCVIGVVADALLSEAAVQSSSPETRSTSVDLAAVDERVAIVRAAKTEGPRLEEAQIIVAGGRGLREAENYKLVEELAEALGGMAGASRPIVDEGWTDSSHQVGLTGKITRPVLYIAAGISGASQHVVGCSAAKTLVAINTDPDAAIFKYARYGIVGDCLEVLPALTKAVKGE
jgi:electron transfer flavoprotein alpha subunit